MNSLNRFNETFKVVEKWSSRDFVEVCSQYSQEVLDCKVMCAVNCILDNIKAMEKPNRFFVNGENFTTRVLAVRALLDDYLCISTPALIDNATELEQYIITNARKRVQAIRPDVAEIDVFAVSVLFGIHQAVLESSEKNIPPTVPAENQQNFLIANESCEKSLRSGILQPIECQTDTPTAGIADIPPISLVPQPQNTLQQLRQGLEQAVAINDAVLASVDLMIRIFGKFECLKDGLELQKLHRQRTKLVLNQEISLGFIENDISLMTSVSMPENTLQKLRRWHEQVVAVKERVLANVDFLMSRIVDGSVDLKSAIAKTKFDQERLKLESNQQALVVSLESMIKLVDADVNHS